MMNKKKFAVPAYVTAEEIKTIRNRWKLTQKEFAAMIGCSKPTIERWETSEAPIKGPIVMLLQMIEKNPRYIDEILIPEREYPLRLCYMYRQKLCTIIDVDEVKQRVAVRNYTDNLMFRAFGINENPSYQEYQEFLESRCFPESRDKLKLILRDLDLPFYDPIMIIQKTEGRMAEDDFWIQVEMKDD